MTNWTASAGPAAARYRALESARQPFLDRAREAARLTVPGLMPPEGHGAASDLPTPYQGVGARGVNNLANKLLLAQFPPNTPFFRLALDEAESLGLDDDPELKAGVDSALTKMERALMSEIETGFLRAGLHAALKQLIVGGNALLHLADDGGLRVFRLDRYVVRRDPMGRVQEIVAREAVFPDALPMEMRASAERAAEVRGSASGPERPIDLYTHIERGVGPDGRALWAIRQEAGGLVVPGSEGSIPDGMLDWLALRWSHVDGEDYGRGQVEEYVGDLKSLEGLMQSVVEGAAAAAKLTVLVSPNGQTDAEALAEAENGAIIDGEAGDVTVLQAGKHHDFRVALDAVGMLTERLSFAFLLNSAVRRDAERVTAEEIRYMAAELEGALGGVYSVLAEELQKPLVTVLAGHAARRGALPTLPPGVVKPMILTGLDALGRGYDFDRLNTFLAFLAQVAGVAAQPGGDRLDIGAVLLRGAAGLGVDASDLLRPEEDVATEAEQSRNLELLRTLGKELLQSEDAQALAAQVGSALTAGAAGAAGAA